jgi:deoxyribonuclease V
MRFYIPSSLEKAKEIQKELSSFVKIERKVERIELIGGIDSSYQKDKIRTALVTLSFPELEVIDFSVFEDKVRFPYIPSFLAFREIPSMLGAWENIKIKPQLILVDGNGIAHPRKLGIASHFGVLLNVPTIGCAKNPFYPSPLPSLERGAFSYMKNEKNEIVGASLRTKENVMPIYVSPGHLVDLDFSIEIIISTSKFRIPEPIRVAHHLSRH